MSNFNIQKLGQVNLEVNRFEIWAYDHLHQAASKTEWIRPAGLLIGCAKGLLTIAKTVATIAETIFKGLGNILGSRFSKKCHFKLGCKQLLTLPRELFLGIPFSLLVGVWELGEHAVKITFGDPKSFFEANLNRALEFQKNCSKGVQLDENETEPNLELFAF